MRCNKGITLKSYVIAKLLIAAFLVIWRRS
jgi:hypothetical protein